MIVSDLWDKHTGEDIYIVGTGPSMRVFPLEVLSGKTTIGLNNAWRILSTTYSVTAHPELVIEYEKAERTIETQWIVKGGKTPLRVGKKDPRYYVWTSEKVAIRNGHNLDLVRNRVGIKLYFGRGIQQTAMNIAVHMGCKAIFLVGVDMCQIGNDHHGIEQHVRFCGLEPSDVYREYRLFTDHIRNVIQFELGIPVVTLSPFLGINHAEEDYHRLSRRMNLADLPVPEDTSRFTRKKIEDNPHKKYT